MERAFKVEKELYKTLYILSKSIKEVRIKGLKLKTEDSFRYTNFYMHGIACVKCGLRASYGAIERFNRNTDWHLNLYGIDAEGKEVLLTKDHIYPRSKGGVNEMHNFQTMCINCNEKKGITTNLTFEEAVARGLATEQDREDHKREMKEKQEQRKLIKKYKAEREAKRRAKALEEKKQRIALQKKREERNKKRKERKRLCSMESCQ